MSDYSGGQFFRLPTWLCDEVLICSPFTDGVTKCLFAIARKTIGYGKKSDAISLSQFQSMTNLCRQTVIDSCEFLAANGLVTRKKGPRKTWIYNLNTKEEILEIVDKFNGKAKKRNKTTSLSNRPMTSLSNRPLTSLSDRPLNDENDKLPIAKDSPTSLSNRPMTSLSNRPMTSLSNRPLTSLSDRPLNDENDKLPIAKDSPTSLSNRPMTSLSNRHTIDINRYIYINIYRSLVRTFKVGEVGYFEEIKPIDESEKTLLVEVKPKPKAKKKIIYEERDFKCAEWMLSRVNTALLSIGYKDTQANLEKWANTIRLMRTQDKHSYKEIFELFNWANSDEFWKINIRSPDKLRKQWVELNVRRHKEISKVKTLRSNSSSTSWVDSNTQALANALFMEPANNPLLPTIEELESNLLTGKNGV